MKRLKFYVYQTLSIKSNVALSTSISIVLKTIQIISNTEGYWNGLPFTFPGDLPDLGIKPMSLMSPGLAGGFFTKHLVQYNKIKFAD